MANQQDDPSTLIVPFGKHQGLTVAELVVRDPAYVEWLLGQSWLAQRFAKLHEAIITRGATPDDTPEHNQIQARFLDPSFRAATILASTPKNFESSRYRHEAYEDYEDDINRRARWRNIYKTEPEGPEPINPGPDTRPLVTAVVFEASGVDAHISWGFERIGHRNWINVEIKPSLGDDYPSVMRQMQRLGVTVLVIEQYASSNLPLSTVREMFKANGQILITIQDILDKIPNAKNFMGNSP